MESILEIISVGEEVNYVDKDDYKDDSIWIKDKNIYRGSNDIKLTNKLEPGSYIANLNQEMGLFCVKTKSETDELFIFTDNTINTIINEIQSFWKKGDVYAKENLIHKRGILMYGPPGTGKTATIELISKDLISRGGVVFKVQHPNDLAIHISFLQSSFRLIQPDTPVITILEDIDKYEQHESELLDFLDGKNQINHHVVIMTTNDTTNLPSNLLRPSRVDLKIFVSTPSNIVRHEYLKFKEVPEDDIEELVELTEGFSLADLKEIFI